MIVISILLGCNRWLKYVGLTEIIGLLVDRAPTHTHTQTHTQTHTHTHTHTHRHTDTHTPPTQRKSLGCLIMSRAAVCFYVCVCERENTHTYTQGYITTFNHTNTNTHTHT